VSGVALKYAKAKCVDWPILSFGAFLRSAERPGGLDSRIKNGAANDFAGIFLAYMELSMASSDRDRDVVDLGYAMSCQRSTSVGQGGSGVTGSKVEHSSSVR
jgi:hypothetical protein